MADDNYAPSMELWFSRIDPKHHRFRVVRPGFEPIDVALVTRSMLLHDLAHYAYESARELNDGFFGLLASGRSLEALRDWRSLPDGPRDALMALEKEVALLQSAFKHGAISCSAGDARLLRNMWGAWSKAEQGQALHLCWPDPTPELVTAPAE